MGGEVVVVFQRILPLKLEEMVLLEWLSLQNMFYLEII
jgi:hypothetical protein